MKGTGRWEGWLVGDDGFFQRGREVHRLFSSGAERVAILEFCGFSRGSFLGNIGSIGSLIVVGRIARSLVVSGCQEAWI